MEQEIISYAGAKASSEGTSLITLLIPGNLSL